MTKVNAGRNTSAIGKRPSSIKVSEEGLFKASQPEINFTGNANVSNDISNNRVNIDIPLVASGTSIQFQDEGVNLGNNEADTVNFVGAGVTATRTLNKITVTIPGSSAASWGSITGTITAQTDLINYINNLIPSEISSGM
ncbi:MAG TPA: hypothetical protein PLN38_16925 [Chitinophagales bacterium]|nr:hypothetical protein [Chitinophagales bacterium]